MKTFYDWRERCRKSGVESHHFVAYDGKSAVVLRGSGLQVAADLGKTEEEFERACERALKQFADLRLGWGLRAPVGNPVGEG